MNKDALLHEPIQMPVQECKVIDFYKRIPTAYLLDCEERIKRNYIEKGIY